MCPISFTMNNRERQKVGITLLDQDKQPFDGLPEGASFETENSSPDVLQFVKDDVPVTGDNGEKYAVTGDIVSGRNGVGNIRAKVTFADGKVFTDEATGAVTNSAAESVGFSTIGAPRPEDEAPPEGTPGA